MTRKVRTPSRRRTTRKLEDLSAGPKARKVEGRLSYKLDRCYVKSWSTS